MSLYRCAACGSPNVITDNQNAGVKINAAKAVAGTIAIGAGGALAGLENNTQAVYICKDCGITLSYPMPDDLKQLIDMGLTSAEIRKNAKLMNTRIYWDFITKKYPNIGEVTDSNKEVEPGSARARLIEKYTFDYLSEQGKEILESSREIYITAKEECVQVENEVKKQEHERLKKEIAEANDEANRLTEEIQKHNAELKQCGIFAFSRKKELQEIIANKQNEINRALERAESRTEWLDSKESTNKNIERYKKYCYAALKTIGSPAVHTQIVQIIQYFEGKENSITLDQDMAVSIGLRRLIERGIVGIEDSHLEDPNNKNAYFLE